MISILKSSLIILLTVFSIVCISSIAISQQNNLEFEYISIDQGLSQSTVTDIIQDKYGYMWFGTDNGLNRYDGYNFKIYKTVPDNINSISGNKINVLFIDSNDFLWIGTDNGLNKYDHSTNKFERYQHSENNPNSISSNNVTAIAEDNEGNLWIGTAQDGLNKYDIKKDEFTEYKNIPGENQVLSSNEILSLLKVNNGNIWIGTYHGLNIYSVTDKTKKKFSSIFQDKLDPDNPIISSLYQDKNKNIWIGTPSNLYKVDRLSDALLIVNKPLSGQNKSNETTSFIEDHDDNIWAGTKVGIYKINSDGNGEFITPDPRESVGSEYHFFSLYIDNSGVIWGGTRGSGILKCNPYRSKFRSYKHIPGEKNSLGERTVRAVYLDSDSILWVGTQGAGLDRIDRKTGEYRNYRLNAVDPENTLSNIVWDIYDDKNGNLWLASRNSGIIKFNKKNGEYKTFLTDPNNIKSISTNMIETIFEDSDGYFWIGTVYENGIDKFDPVTEEFEHIYENNSKLNSSYHHVYTINEDNNKNIWIGTREGLKIIDQINGQYKTYRNDPNDPESLSFNFVSSIFKDKNGIMWMGTYGGGLNKYNPETDKFERFGKEHGLANSIIYSILEDKDGNLWISTNEGISKFYRNTEYFKNFDISYGIQGYEYNLGVSYKSADGEMFFGGMNGLNSFHPSDIRTNNTPPQLVFTSLKILGKEYENLSGLNIDRSLNLDHTQSHLEFEFAALDFVDPNSNNYMYKMDGVDDEWILCGNRRFANYSLNPGDYKFSVKGSNSDNVWNEEGISLEIIIPKPFWATWTFRSITLVSIFVCFFVVHRIKVNSIKERSLELEAINKNLNNEIVKRKKLQEQHAVFYLLAESSGQAIGIADLNGITTYTNPKLCRLLELDTPKDFTGKTIQNFYPPELHDRLQNEILPIVREKGYWSGESKMISTKGKETPVVECIFLVRNHDGEVIGYANFVTDITERISAEEERKKLEEQLFQAQKMESIGRLAGGLAHDFNNILSGIMGYGEILKTRFTDTSTSNGKAADVIFKGATRASKLTRQLLSFSRKEKHNTFPLEINIVIKEAIKMSERIFEKKIKIEKLFEENIWLVNADESQLNQVFTNLIINGRDAMPEGGRLIFETKNVCLGTEDTKFAPDLVEGKYIKVSVTDTGSGISSEVRSKIFEPFFTTKSADKGTGLGLATVYALIKKHRGHIDVYSEPGEGTTFSIYLPVSHETPGVPIEESNIVLGTGKILIVDDEEEIRDVTRQQLDSLGYKTVLAKSGIEALDLYEKNKDEIDLILLDFIMPAMDGAVTYKKLKEINPEVKVVLISGYGQKGKIQDLHKDGINGFLQKPFNIVELSTLIAEVKNK